MYILSASESVSAEFDGFTKRTSAKNGEDGGGLNPGSTQIRTLGLDQREEAEYQYQEPGSTQVQPRFNPGLIQFGSTQITSRFESRFELRFNSG